MNNLIKDNIYIFLFLIISLVSFSSCEKRNDLVEKNLKGEVKYLEESTYFKESYYDSVFLKIITNYKFNIYGYKTEKNVFLPNGNLRDKIYYKYNNSNKIVEECHYNKYDSLKMKFIFKYDDSGKEIVKNGYSSEDILVYKVESKYDERQNLVEKASTSFLALPRIYRYKYIYKYDKNGNKIEEYYYNKGDLVNWYSYKYDERGNEIEKINYSAGKSEGIKYTSKYDENGYVIEKNIFSLDGSLSSKTLFKHDDKGNVIEVYGSTADVKNSKIISEYIFDENANWVKKTKSENGIIMAYTERKILYY